MATPTRSGTGSRLDPDVDAVRAFNRFWTGQIGLLDAGLVDTPYTLTEARVLFELARPEGPPGTTDVADLRRRLGLDSGYLSRLLGRFRADGLVTTDISALDGRRQVASLTPQGREVFAVLDARSAAQVAALLEPHAEPDRRRVVEAMATIRRVLTPAPPLPGYVIRPLRAGDAGWIVQANAVIYATEYGWDQTYEALVARIVADHIDQRDPRWENAWIAEVDGQPAGCVMCVRRDERTAQLRLLLVEGRARGSGLGTRLVDECLAFARRAGYERIVLWTNDVLVSARRIYEAAGFTLVEEEPHHSFGHDLVGQTWSLDLS
jgi:DNA-binding MarR family transcriptional regulator/GNAT superfamily N-acetyltransferase